MSTLANSADRDTIRAVIRIVEKAWSGGRFPEDRCTCGGDRSDHLGRAAGCVGPCCWRCDDEDICRRFTLDERYAFPPKVCTTLDVLRDLARVTVTNEANEANEGDAT